MKIIRRIFTHLFAFWAGGAIPFSCMVHSLGGNSDAILKYGLGWPYWTFIYVEHLVRQSFSSCPF